MLFRFRFFISTAVCGQVEFYFLRLLRGYIQTAVNGVNGKFSIIAVTYLIICVDAKIHATRFFFGSRIFFFDFILMLFFRIFEP